MSNETSGNGERADALMRALRRLPQEIEPSRDLWPGISDGILGKPAHAIWRGRQMWPYALAAGVACMALGALLTFGLMRSQTAPVANGNGQDFAQQPARFTEANFGGYAALGPEYETARASLAIGLAEKMDRLPPEAQQKVERNMGEIRRALREINVALEVEPDSALLQQLLLSTYQHELALLANVNQMAGSLPARTET